MVTTLRTTRKYGSTKTRAARNTRILELRSNGKSLVDIAKRFGLTRQRIHQIVTG